MRNEFSLRSAPPSPLQFPATRLTSPIFPYQPATAQPAGLSTKRPHNFPHTVVNSCPFAFHFGAGLHSVGFPAAQLRRPTPRPPATVPICVWQQLNLRPFIHFPKKVKLSNINLRFLFCIWMNSTWLLQRIFLLMRFFLSPSLSLFTDASARWRRI